MSIEQSNLELKDARASTMQPATYEAPAIESVLTPESLEREVHYAGNIPVSQTKT